jgi:hypothetical protein
MPPEATWVDLWLISSRKKDLPATDTGLPKNGHQ